MIQLIRSRKSHMTSLNNNDLGRFLRVLTSWNSAPSRRSRCRAAVTHWPLFKADSPTSKPAEMWPSNRVTVKVLNLLHVQLQRCYAVCMSVIDRCYWTMICIKMMFSWSLEFKTKLWMKPSGHGLSRLSIYYFQLNHFIRFALVWMWLSAADM